MDQVSVRQMAKEMREGHRSVVETCQSFLDMAKKKNPSTNAFVLWEESALEKAKEMESRSSKEGALFGVPIAVKDNFCTKGLRTTASSRILENFIPPYTAHCIELLEKEGAVIIGKTNLDEFAMGSSNENSHFSSCKNPWDLTRVPGGSSGGSASAVAASMAPLSIGSDTGGSIRQPAHFCGVVGVKPTYGSISRYGMVAFASSLDQAGPMAKNVEDAALALDIMIGKDERDATNVSRQQESLRDLTPTNLKGLKVGLPKEYMTDELEEGSREVLGSTIEQLKASGCEVVEVSLPHTEYAIPVYYLVAASEASSNLSRYDGVRYGLRDVEMEDGHSVTDLADFYKLTRSRGFGDEVKRRILLGTFALSAGYFDAFYTKACQVRRLIADDFISAFNECDLIISPVSTGSAFKLGEKTDDPVSMYYNDVFTTPANLAGLPALSLPVGLDDKKMPVGLQVIAPSFQEKRMLEFALAVEKLVDFKETPSE